jgi:hypothetical protein
MFKIIGQYKGRQEVLDWVSFEDEAIKLVYEYKLAFGSDWLIWYKEVPD